VAAVHNGNAVAATVLDPERNECFSAARGMGATLNGVPINTSGTDELEQALLAFSLPANVQSDDPALADVMGVATRCRAVRRVGAAALNLCYVGAGRLDGYWARSLHPWDLAAGSLIAAEAGGCVRTIGENRVLVHQPSIIAAASDRLHDQIRQSIR